MAKKPERVPAAPARKPHLVGLIQQLQCRVETQADMDALTTIQRAVVDLLVTGEALVREADAAAQREGGNRDPSHNTAVRAAIRAQNIARFGDNG